MKGFAYCPRKRFLCVNRYQMHAVRSSNHERQFFDFQKGVLLLKCVCGTITVLTFKFMSGQLTFYSNMGCTLTLCIQALNLSRLHRPYELSSTPATIQEQQLFCRFVRLGTCSYAVMVVWVIYWSHTRARSIVATDSTIPPSIQRLLCLNYSLFLFFLMCSLVLIFCLQTGWPCPNP